MYLRVVALLPLFNKMVLVRSSMKTIISCQNQILGLVNKDSVGIKGVCTNSDKEAASQCYLLHSEKEMYLPTFLSLSALALLLLGATQEFVILTRNQLREEIQAGITAALSSGNQSHSILNLLRNDLCTCDRLNATL